MLTVLVVAEPARAADVAAITVTTSGNNGSPQHYGSGFIYGLTEDGQNPPSNLLTGMGFNYNRAGGAQLDSPGGWYGGTYPRHFQATLNQYNRAKSLGANFVILLHDLYGADGTALSRWPGDNGDWSNYDAFLQRVIADVRSNNMNVEWDLWNEPDYPIFWPSGRQAQFLELWRRSYVAVKAAFPNAVIVGPSTNAEPSESSDWWRTYLDFVKANNVVPTTFSWHEIPGYPNGNDPVTSKSVLQSMLASRSIVGNFIYQVNEYGNPGDQYPAKSAWYIARLERSRIHGLRSNWASGKNLIDNASDLLYKDGTTYRTRGDWQTYAAYIGETGTVVPTQTTNSAVDGYATRSADNSTAQVLVGNFGSLNGRVGINLAAGGPVQAGANVRVVVQRISEGDGAENLGPTTETDSVQTVPNSGTLATGVDFATTRDAFLVTVKKMTTPSAIDGRTTLGTSVNNLRGGRTTTVSSTYVNAGSITQTGVTVTPRLPAGWSATPASQQLGTVSPGQSVAVNFDVSVPTSDIGKRVTFALTSSWQESGSTFSSVGWTRLTVPCGVGTTCESENGTITQAVIATDHQGYTGTGFVAGMVGVGAAVTQTVAADSAGTYSLKLRYAAGPDGPSAGVNRTMGVSINGRSSVVTFPKTSTWDAWATVTLSVSLPAGVSTVRVSYDSNTTGWINLDNVQLSGGGGSSACTPGNLCESELGIKAGGAGVASDHSGFTGSGFVAGLTGVGASVSQSLTTTAAGSYTLVLRYSAGPNGPSAGVDRTMTVTVNGQASSVTLPKTSTWDVWGTVSRRVTLPSGSSVVKISYEATNSGWINLDSISI